jgi:hypothetical protein
MTSDEEKEIKEGLTSTRDNLQSVLGEARKLRSEIRISNRDRFREFQQKIGELSFAFGAAIVPLVIVTHANESIKDVTYVLVGVTLYLLNGLTAMWRTKTILEQDADDAPHIGLEEEITTYPVIYGLNKLLFDLDNTDYQQEYLEAQQAVPRTTPTESGKVKVKANFTGDGLLLVFVVASLLVTRPVWPYKSWIYWLVFAAVILFVLILAGLSYLRTWKNQINLNQKREKLAGIKSEYEKWEAKIMKKRNDS